MRVHRDVPLARAAARASRRGRSGRASGRLRPGGHRVPTKSRGSPPDGLRIAPEPVSTRNHESSVAHDEDVHHHRAVRRPRRRQPAALSSLASRYTCGASAIPRERLQAIERELRTNGTDVPVPRGSLGEGASGSTRSAAGPRRCPLTAAGCDRVRPRARRRHVVAGEPAAQAVQAGKEHALVDVGLVQLVADLPLQPGRHDDTAAEFRVSRSQSSRTAFGLDISEKSASWFRIRGRPRAARQRRRTASRRKRIEFAAASGSPQHFDGQRIGSFLLAGSCGAAAADACWPRRN